MKKIKNYELQITSANRNYLTVLRSYALTVFFLLGLLPFSMQAQVTIGKNEEPKPYAVLELFSQYESGTYGGLHLPQLTTTQRDALGLTADAECRGLMIYNLTNDCMEIWNGTKWISICGDTSGGGGDPETFAQGEVKGNGGTTLKFMTYNLGAASAVQSMTVAQQAAHTNPEDTYGDLYQWGRMADGHEKRTSPTIAGPVSALDANGQPTGAAIGNFITLLDGDWRTPQDDNLWKKPKTVQDPCPAGWRVPTEAEWGAVLDNNTWTWQSSPVSGYKISPDGGSTTTLFLPFAGYREDYYGDVFSYGNQGIYWSSTAKGVNAQCIIFNTSWILVSHYSRASGLSVRCVSE